ncbi:MFS transporter [Propionicicella superfundia]|uniref:MFS transporter n=1 Tax=Propionicicella superfundia TaxID=348582 RepID=UPI000411EE97|nr:MFS transporter [Propionicicella superfundia]
MTVDVSGAERLPTAARRRQQRSWYWYDWANSAFITTTSTVIIGPYLTSIATTAACGPDVETADCTTPLQVLGFIPVLPGALHPYMVTFSTLTSAILLIIIGAIADRSPHPQRLLGGFAWVGAAAGSLLFFLGGTNWQLGVVLFLIANFCMGASLVIYDAVLCRIATPDERDRVSSRGWAWGYIGGGLLLAGNLALMTLHASVGLSYELAIRISLLSAGLWWGIFTVIPVLGLRRLPRTALDELAPAPGEGRVRAAFTQLADTFRDLRHYPQTLLFLVAYLFFNDGIQTVIGQSSLYAQAELGMTTSQVMIVFLLIQFTAFFGALGFGAIAARRGAKLTVLVGIGIWLGVVVVAFFIPGGVFAAFAGLGVAIAVVMGGTQALSRSLYSQLVPVGRESEYFSLYQAMERGTSWTGTLVFGLVFSLTGTYRASIVALIVFFVVGGLLLSRVDMRKGILDAGNELPKVY